MTKACCILSFNTLFFALGNALSYQLVFIHDKNQKYIRN